MLYKISKLAYKMPHTLNKISDMLCAYNKALKKNCVSITRLTLFQTPNSAIFYSVKMQNKKVKHWPSTKYLIFIQLQAWPFFSVEKIENKKKFLLPTNQIFFQDVYALLLKQSISRNLESAIWHLH